MKLAAGWGITLLVVIGCSSSSSGGNGASAGTGAVAGSSGVGGSGGVGGGSAAGAGGTSAAGHAGTSSVAGAGQALYGSLGTVGTGTVPCHGTCAPNQVCCELMLGIGATCVDSFEACAEKASASDTKPAAYGCNSNTQCAGGQCCGKLNAQPSVVHILASSCRPTCASDEEPLCGADTECTAPETCNTAGTEPGRCF